MINYFLAILIILALLMSWLTVQALCRRYAERHPEFGPYREEGAGCGSSCSCTGKCERHSAKRIQTKYHTIRRAL